MAELQHFSHECPLSSPTIIGNCICSICYKDEPIELGCSTCNFSLCKVCSQLPQKVSHDFHLEHPLELCLHRYDQKPGHILCSGCGNMSSGSFYKCKECEIYLDLDCALMVNIFRGWDAKELLHESHSHLLKRSRPGPDARGSCLLCELPLSPSAVCYGCVYCYSFVHDRCVDLPREIMHPVHPAHPLKRLDYTRTRPCDICKECIVSAPFGCLECNLDFHLRCLDSLLRGLMHKSHQHMLIYRTDAREHFSEENQCHICKRSSVISLDSYFYCMECSLSFHFECLEIPEFLVSKAYHVHPLVCKTFLPEEDCLEYCGACETVMYLGHHAYSCEECDYLGHISCILNKEVPSPLQLKDMYSCSKDNTGPTDHEEDHNKSNELETKLTVNSMTGHIHVMRLVDSGELNGSANCDICKTRILGIPCKCETCNFQTHSFCAELGRPIRHLVHRKHPLILLPKPQAAAPGVTMNCDICKNDIEEFNLFCRVCNFIIHTNCIFKGKHLFGELSRGQKIIGSWTGRCVQKKHRLVQVLVSRSYTKACAICDERVCGKVVSCLECGDIFHPLCTEVWKQTLSHHPLHPDHSLKISFVSGSKCIACKVKNKKYGYHCSICEVSFHIECIKAVRSPREINPHSHYFYQFWVGGSRATQACCVCARPCGMSFYGCIDCNCNAHVECIGFPSNVKNKKHQHTVAQRLSSYRSSCSLCGKSIDHNKYMYSCKHCIFEFHIKCIMSSVKDNPEATTEEDQLGDIYYMYIERSLLNLLKESKS